MLIGTSITLHLEHDNARSRSSDYSDYITITFSVAHGQGEIHTQTGSRHVEASVTLDELETLARSLLAMIAHDKSIADAEVEEYP